MQRRQTRAPPPPKPRGGPRGAGGGEEQTGQASLSAITTHALFALKVHRKVSNGVAQLAAAGSSLDRPQTAAIPAISAMDQRPAQASLLRPWH
jgi:hypothetical protein